MDKKPLSIPTDLIIAILIAAGCGIFIFSKYDFSLPPFEDAAMLIRYSNNLADGHGIVFNPGGEAVDGATDFLFMMLVSTFRQLGMQSESAVTFLCLASHFLSIVLIYFIVARICLAPRWMALLSSVYFGIGVGPAYAEVLFGTPVFAFFCLLAWAFALRLMLYGITRTDTLGFALASLLAGLTRPEGVIYAILMLAAIVGLRGWKESKLMLKPYVLGFVLPGAFYFIWHWVYFGYALPNPYYVKGRGSLHIDSFKSSLVASWILLKPLLPVLSLGLIPKIGSSRTFWILFPTLGFLCAWVLMSNEMNYIFRFQYPAIALLIATWPFVLNEVIGKNQRIQNLITRTGLLYPAAALLFMGLSVFYQVRKNSSFPRPHHDGKIEVAQDLAAFKEKGYRMAITEAGILPLYSGWPSLDAWGLNHKGIAHAGKVDESFLDEWKPELIMFHDSYTPRTVERKRMGRWSDMCDVLKAYAEKHHYTLAASWAENENDGYWYYVKPGFEDTETLVKLIRDREYISLMSGKALANFAE